jgi:hypothetical protein
MAVAVLAACAACSGDDEVETSDVTGTWIDVWVTEEGSVEVPRYLSLAVSAGIHGETDSTIISGTGFEDGTFVVPSVPEGEFSLLTYGPGVLDVYYTEERHVDLGGYEPGRPNRSQGEVAELLVDVDGLDPWSDTDELVASSYSSDGHTRPLSGDDIAAAATQAEGLAMSWIHGGLPDASQGDVTHWTQSRAEPGPLGLEIRTLVAHAASDLTLAPGGSENLEVTLAEIPGDTVDAWDIRVGEFLSLAGANPLVEEGRRSLRIVATPEPGFAGAAGLSVLSAEGPASAGADMQFEAPRRDPYPSAWGRVVEFTLELTGRLPADGAASPKGPPMSFSTLLPIELARAEPIRPRLGPARNLRLDGKSCAEPITVAARPVLEWDPPELGTPVFYVVRAFRLHEGEFVLEQVHRTNLTQSRVVAPVGLPGATYVFTVKAFASPGLSPAAPREQPLPLDTAETLSNLVTFSGLD